MKKLFLAALMVLMAIVIFNAIPVQACELPISRALLAGGGGPRAKSRFCVGEVTVAIEGDNLVVTYTTEHGWILTETHLYVGTSCPTKSAPGRFPYSNEDLSVTTYTYSIPLSEVGDGSICIAAHAVVQKSTCDGLLEETAWAYGCRFGKGRNWAMCFCIDLC